MNEEETMVGCYVCEKEVGTENPFFPFCSGVCKEKWKSENPVPNKVGQGKYKTIQDCQRRIAELRERKNNPGGAVRMF